jgi:hypothetical protein
MTDTTAEAIRVLKELSEWKKKATVILENLQYWDTCPDDMKEQLKELLIEEK